LGLCSKAVSIIEEMVIIMTKKERYEQVDMPFYKKEVAPILPPQILDFHTHVWTKKQWEKVPWEENFTGSKYMVVQTDYPFEKLLADGRLIFPDRIYQAVCFGFPGPATNLELANDYTAKAGQESNLFSLMLAGRDKMPREKIEQRILKDGFLGYKMNIDWYGNDYKNITIEDMIGSVEMKLANKYQLIVLLHVPGEKRLVDPKVQAGVRKLSQNYPNSQIVLAHCGRCYLPDEMARAIKGVKDLKNVYLDTAMVMEPLVFQIVFEAIDSKRVLFGTDFPIANMRGRRGYVMDHWVDIVLAGYPPSAYRVEAKDIRATFMAYEIILAIRRAAEKARLSKGQLRAIFYDNGLAVLKSVNNHNPKKNQGGKK